MSKFTENNKYPTENPKICVHTEYTEVGATFANSFSISYQIHVCVFEQESKEIQLHLMSPNMVTVRAKSSALGRLFHGIPFHACT
jgi:hypothetical protein